MSVLESSNNSMKNRIKSASANIRFEVFRDVVESPRNRLTACLTGDVRQF